MKKQELQTLKAYMMPSGQMRPEFVGKSHPEIAAILAEPSSAPIDREQCDTAELAACFTAADVKSIKNDEAAWLAFIMRAPTIRLTADVKSQLGAIAPVATPLGQRVSAITGRLGSIYETLGISRPNESDVADALLRT